MKIDYTDIPDRGPVEPLVELNPAGQPKWKIPEACVIKVAVVGRPPGRKGSPVPNIPGTVPTDNEMKLIVEQTMQCIEAGACCVHYHAVGQNAQDWANQWHRFCDPIRTKYGNDVAIDFPLCARPKWEDEAYLIKAMADVCEFSPVTMSLRGKVQWEKLTQAEVQLCQENGVKPEIACWTEGDIDIARSFIIETGIAQKPTLWNLIPSYWVGGTPMFNEFAMAESLMNMVRQIRYIEPDAQIMVTSSGRASSHLIAMSIMLGLHVMVGMEDTYFWYPNKDDVMDDNVRNVAETVTLCKILGRRPATANEYRAFVGLPQRE